MFSAIYLPARPSGRPDPSKDGFTTQEDAEKYIDTQVCEDCRRAHLEPDGFDPCYCEWLIAPTVQVEAAESMEDLFEAAGWKKVYERGEDNENSDSTK